MRALTLSSLRDRVAGLKFDRVNGATSSQATLRLFGKKEEDVRVTLYRDNHAWCPYCQKVWLWLEEKRVPYRIEKVTMFCYGKKESWYKRVVPSGMLPALKLDGKVITESDVILQSLENTFGELYSSMTSPRVMNLRRLERLLFRAWCEWLCYPNKPDQEREAKEQFERVLSMVESELQKEAGAFFLDEFSIADVVFVPYLERMCASLYYYKGYQIRNRNVWPNVSSWFDGLELMQSYRGTQSDFHTHVHDLPPQMGGCYTSTLPEDLDKVAENQRQVDHGPWDKLPDVGYKVSKEESNLIAVQRVVKHWETILKINPAKPAVFDVALRCALTLLLESETPQEVATLPKEAAGALRYMRDRISVPRDMPIHSAKDLRRVLEDTADLIGPMQGKPIPYNHRKDQSRVPFNKI